MHRRLVNKLTETVVKVDEASDRILDRLSEACNQVDAKVNQTMDEASQLAHKAKQILRPKDTLDEKTKLAETLPKQRPTSTGRPRETEPTPVEQEITRDII